VPRPSAPEDGAAVIARCGGCGAFRGGIASVAQRGHTLSPQFLPSLSQRIERVLRALALRVWSFRPSARTTSSPGESARTSFSMSGRFRGVQARRPSRSRPPADPAPCKLSLSSAAAQPRPSAPRQGAAKRAFSSARFPTRMLAPPLTGPPRAVSRARHRGTSAHRHGGRRQACGAPVDRAERPAGSRDIVVAWGGPDGSSRDLSVERGFRQAVRLAAAKKAARNSAEIRAPRSTDSRPRNLQRAADP
jgi:hypothetical protein